MPFLSMIRALMTICYIRKQLSFNLSKLVYNMVYHLKHLFVLLRLKTCDLLRSCEIILSCQSPQVYI